MFGSDHWPDKLQIWVSSQLWVQTTGVFFILIGPHLNCTEILGTKQPGNRVGKRRKTDVRIDTPSKKEI